MSVLVLHDPHTQPSSTTKACTHTHTHMHTHTCTHTCTHTHAHTHMHTHTHAHTHKYWDKGWVWIHKSYIKFPRCCGIQQCSLWCWHWSNLPGWCSLPWQRKSSHWLLTCPLSIRPVSPWPLRGCWSEMSRYTYVAVLGRNLTIFCCIFCIDALIHDTSTQHVWAPCMRTLNRSSTLQHFKDCIAIKLHNRIMFDFYPRLPHMTFWCFLLHKVSVSVSTLPSSHY